MPVWVWIILGVVLLALLSGNKGKGGRGSSAARPFRIDHPHYMDPDDCECSRCGARFPEEQMECPVCGARFGTATTDDGEFMEEMEIWDGDDD